MSNFLTRALIESDSGGYVIERSLRFMSASSQYLTRTPSVAGDQQKFTISMWVKRGALPSGYLTLLAARSGSSGTFAALWLYNDALSFQTSSPSNLTTTQVLRDPGAHFNVVLAVDTTQTTASDRVKLYINGSLVTSFSTATYPTINSSLNINSTAPHYIGQQNNSEFFDGYQAEDYLISGQALPPSSFGEIDQTTGQWVAKKYTGTYGTNGSYLDFKDGTSTTTLGYDKSGNNNHWTLTNFTRSAGVNDCWMLDVPAGNGSASAIQPSGNYAVLNNITPVKTAITRANLRSGTGDTWANSSLAMTSGKWYAEYTITTLAVAQWVGVGRNQPVAAQYNGGLSADYSYANDGLKYNNGATAAYGATYTSGDVIGVAYDADNATLTFYKNGVSQGTAYSSIPAGQYYFQCYGRSTGGSSVVDANFGQRSFAYTPPTGFKALCTANLPTPSIKKPSDHFNVQLSTGANIKTDSEALFTNELEWIKDRANANNHQLIDSVRGSTAVLQSNTTAAETTYTAPSGSSVGWVWRASDSAPVTNNNGSISSQVSANPTAGFSIVEFISNSGTVGHGLGTIPKVIFIKPKTGVVNWTVYHEGLGNASGLILNNANTQLVSSSTYFNSTSPTTTVFSLGSVFNTLGSSIAYCFSEISGYSKFGTFFGNGSADGTFVYLGFIPKLIIIKAYTSNTGWIMYDSARSSSNLVSLYLGCEASSAESSLGGVDFCSNGFKIRASTSGLNQNGVGFIYMAFAESPINYANAR